MRAGTGGTFLDGKGGLGPAPVLFGTGGKLRAGSVGGGPTGGPVLSFAGRGGGGPAGGSDKSEGNEGAAPLGGPGAGLVGAGDEVSPDGRGAPNGELEG